MAKRQLVINNGPGKFELMEALFGSGQDRRVKIVRFEFNVRAQEGKGAVLSGVYAQIKAVEVEDGSGESWNLQGFYSVQGPPMLNFSAHYNTRDRRGTMIIEFGG